MTDKNQKRGLRPISSAKSVSVPDVPRDARSNMATNNVAMPPLQITLDQWDARYEQIAAAGLPFPGYVGPLRRHEQGGDFRLRHLLYDNSPAALRLWNFLLTEEERLRAAAAQGKKIVGAMKDLGTVPVMAFSLPDVVAFYPDGAWWVPCIMELTSGDLRVADQLGIDESFCPVRAMLGAFARGAHFPRPDLLVCSAGATCDDFSAISQRLAAMGFPILWWEIPHRRKPDAGEEFVMLPGGFAGPAPSVMGGGHPWPTPPEADAAAREGRRAEGEDGRRAKGRADGLTAPASQVRTVHAELERVRRAMESLAGRPLDDAMLAEGIRQANRFRRLLDELRVLAYTARPCPIGALEMLIVEMLAIHFCSDREEAIAVAQDLLAEVRRRVTTKQGVLDEQAVGVFWVNPVADLKVMNLLEQCGGRLCGTEFLFCHALDEIPEDLPPMEALARSALADPMVGPAADRAERIVRDCKRFGAAAVVISRIPGASHCAGESATLARAVRQAGLPVVEIEVPPISDSLQPAIRTRLQALIESVKSEAKSGEPPTAQ